MKEKIVEAARWGASRSNKRATLMTCLLKKGELKSISLLTPTPGDNADGRNEGDDGVHADHKSM